MMTTEAQLRELGFRPLKLDITHQTVSTPQGDGCDFDVIGSVPETPGVYLFTVKDEAGLRVTYVGQTSHLWMVTKGRLPRGGGARGGQRYGRPVHAGQTRQRVNVAIAGELRAGRCVRMWVCPTAVDQLSQVEVELITRFDTITPDGWNRR